MNLEGKKALVTGAARGIGQAIAWELAEAGAAVAVLDLNESACAETTAGVESRGAPSCALGVDVSQAGDVQEKINIVLDLWKSVDIVVNNAGITRDGLIMRMTDEDWDSVISVNLKGVFNVCRALARPMMKQRSGSIVNIASVVGMMGNAGQANYSASKGGVIALTKTLAREFASRGIRVNAVAPGFVQTAMTDRIPEGIREEMIAGIPLGRMGQPDDIARAVAFLASEDSSYITGQVVVVDGGMNI